jgi:sterol 3beta-glucosyltransferase
MKIGIVIFGSRGDIQPYAALAHGLAAAGHEVAITANLDAASIVSAAGVKYVPMDLDSRQWLSSPIGQQALRVGTAPALLDSANAWFAEAMPSIVEGTNAVADGADVVIAGFPMDDYAAAVCEARGVPLILGYLTPWMPTTDFPPALMRIDRPESDLLSGADLLPTYQEFEQIYWRGREDVVNELRASMDLPAVHRPLLQSALDLGVTVLNAYSPAVIPRPAGWGESGVLTGYWRLAAQTRQALGEAVPSERLVNWLAAGPPPVFLGFGSMPILDPAPVIEMAVTAARRAGVRVLIGAGWTELEGVADGLPDDVEVVNEVDHDWLFPLCQAVVHHGGAGTTAAGLTAGRPTFIFSLFFDQAFWGAQVAKLNVGGHGRFFELDLDTLTEALVLLSRDDVRENAAEIGRRLRQEDGVANAIRTITESVPVAVPQ